jgi:mono/diheme cytochrome c family protein
VGTGPFGADTAVIYLAVFPSSFPFVLLQPGENNFENICAGCHENDATGGYGPPLLHSDYLMANRQRPIAIQLTGLPQLPGIPGISGDTATTIYVNDSAIGPSSVGKMGAEGATLDDSDIASEITFVRDFFNGATDNISPAEVKKVRDSLAEADTVSATFNPGETCYYCIDTTDVGY